MWGLAALWGALLALAAAAAAAAAPGEIVWRETGRDGAAVVHLYFFASETCPHCAAGEAFLDEFAAQNPWLVVHRHEVTRSRASVELYQRIARELGEQARFVPAFAFCERMLVGFSGPQTGAALAEALLACRRGAGGAGSPEEAGAAPPPEALELPLLGRVDPARVSLPVFTLVIAALDSFNPCAFFVLLVLLSLLVHARSRSRIFLVGGVFVLFSGLFYLAFMAAWLNVFLVVGELRAVTAAAGTLAVVMGLLQAKDWLSRRGPSLSLSGSARTRLFQRMRGLLQATRTSSVLLGAAALAVAANSYEMLCTAGFPLVFTRVLTLHSLPTPTYYLYLVAYNAVYVLPLAAVVGVFGMTLGARRLTEEQGRGLKLLSGLMLLGLGTVLLAKPSALQNPLLAVALVLGAVALAAVLAGVRRWLRGAEPG
jgi:hypothetical protein